MRAYFATFAIAGSGVAVFMSLSLPLPWLLGPISACLLAAVIGVPMREIKPLNQAMRTILGVAVGASVTPTLLASMIDLWPTLLLITWMVILIGLIGVPYFHYIWKYDFPTSYYSAMPGGLQDMLILGKELGANVRTLSLIHATRVLVIVVIVPFILRSVWDADLHNPPGVVASSLSLNQIAIMIFCALAGWKIAEAVRMLGASILGPLILAALFALGGFLENRPPAEAIWTAQFFIGMTIGVQYTGIKIHEIKRDLSAALGLCLILFILTLIFTSFILLLDLAPPMETLLAFAPGGQAELTALTLIVGADMTFVVIHHVLRIFVVILGAPLFARLFTKKTKN